MRFPLRWRILLFMVLPPVILTGAALWMVNRSVTEQVTASLHQDLARSSLVLENLLAERAEKLGVTARVIVRDPRFFAALTLPGPTSDRHVRATVEGVAKDFDSLTHSDLFQVFDAKGNLLASVGRFSCNKSSRKALVREALAGETVSRLLVDREQQFQVAIVPAIVDQRVAGALLLGARVDGALAADLERMTRGRVTFISGGKIAGTSIESAADRDALLLGLQQGTIKRGREIGQVRVGEESFLTLVRSLPGDLQGETQLYALQRPLSAETGYLTAIQRGLVEMGAIAALMALLAALMTAERITRPVQRLVRAAEEMKRGNYDHALNVDHGDEIGYLARRFDEMRDRERVYVSSLQEVARVRSDFITIASHELRTPIAVIRGYQELLAGGKLGPLTSRQREALQALGANLAILNGIAEDAAWISEAEAERPVLQEAECAILTVVSQAVRIAREDAEGRSVEVVTLVDPELSSIIADGPRLTQALTHLVRNAIRFSPDGESVRVTAEREGEALAIHVQDSGVGLPQGETDELFAHSAMVLPSRHHHSSERVEFKSAGLGLGLAIARAIVEAHGGAIAVASEPGQGSTFTIRVPLRNREVRQAKAA